MNKFIRLWTLLLACVIAMPQLNAQTPGDDFTSRIVNPGFEGTASAVSGSQITGGGTVKQAEGWTLSKALGGWNDIDLRTNSASEPPYVGTNIPYEGKNHYNLWKGHVLELDLNQKITLPAGKYELSAAMEMTNGDREDYLTDQHIYATSVIDGITYKSSALSVIGEGNWEVLKVIFKVKSEQTVVIGAASTGNSENSAGWFCLDAFHLTYLGEPGDLDINDIVAAISKKMEEAVLYDPEGMPQGTYLALTDVMNKAGEINLESPLDEAQDALAKLNQGMMDADEGILLFDTLSILITKAGTVPESYPGFDEFTTIKNKAITALYDFGSLNTDFQEVIKELREGYFAINLANMNTATPDEGKDATWLMENPNYTKEGGDPASLDDKSFEFWNMTWTWNGQPDNWIGNGIISSGPTDEEKVNAYQINGWTFTNVNVNQKLTNLPEGAYTLSASLHLYMGDPSWMKIYADATYQQGSVFAEYTYSAEADPPTPWWQTLTTNKVYVSKDGILSIGFYGTQNGSGGGVDMTNWKLTYYGPEGAADELVAGLVAQAEALRDSVEIEEMIMPVEKSALLAAIELGTTGEDKRQAIVPLQNAIADAKSCVSLYPQVQTELNSAENYLVLGQNMAEVADYIEFENVIKAQWLILETDTTSRFALGGVKNTLRAGTIRYQFKLTKQATTGNPVDVTPAIVNPTIEASAANVVPDGWTCTLSGNTTYSNSGAHYTGDAANRYLDSYNGTAGTLKYTAKQSFDVPNGKYNLKIAARTDGEGVYLFANTGELKVAAVTNNGASGGGIQDSGEYSSNGGLGYGWNWITIEGIEVTDRTIEIGVTCDAAVSKGDEWTGTWFSADDFTLFCTQGEGLVGIEDITTDKEDATSSIYVENGYIKSTEDLPFTVTTVAGFTVPANSQLAPGFYIVTVGGKSVKVAVQ